MPIIDLWVIIAKSVYFLVESNYYLLKKLEEVSFVIMKTIYLTKKLFLLLSVSSSRVLAVNQTATQFSRAYFELKINNYSLNFTIDMRLLLGSTSFTAGSYRPCICFL